MLLFLNVTGTQRTNSVICELISNFRVTNLGSRGNEVQFASGA